MGLMKALYTLKSSNDEQLKAMLDTSSCVNVISVNVRDVNH